VTKKQRKERGKEGKTKKAKNDGREGGGSGRTIPSERGVDASDLIDIEIIGDRRRVALRVVNHTANHRHSLKEGNMRRREKEENFARELPRRPSRDSPQL